MNLPQPAGFCEVCGKELPTVRSPRMRFHHGTCARQAQTAHQRNAYRAKRISERGHYMRGEANQRFAHGPELVMVSEWRLAQPLAETAFGFAEIPDTRFNSDEQPDVVEAMG